MNAIKQGTMNKVYITIEWNVIQLSKKNLLERYQMTQKDFHGV